MNFGMELDAEAFRRIEDDEIHVRLVNWGNWLRYDNTFARLGYPSQAPFVFSPRKGHLVADNDAGGVIGNDGGLDR